MRTIRLLLFAPLLMAFQCEDEIDVEEDSLFDTGIYAGWVLDSQTINGVTELTPLPEMILEFYPDNNAQDNKGEYNLEEPSSNTIGIFVMDMTEQKIIFEREGRDNIIYGYSINAAKDYIIFTFSESDAQFEQGWRRLY